MAPQLQIARMDTENGRFWHALAQGAVHRSHEAPHPGVAVCGCAAIFRPALSEGERATANSHRRSRPAAQALPHRPVRTRCARLTQTPSNPGGTTAGLERASLHRLSPLRTRQGVGRRRQAVATECSSQLPFFQPAAVSPGWRRTGPASAERLRDAPAARGREDEVRAAPQLAVIGVYRRPSVVPNTVLISHMYSIYLSDISQQLNHPALHWQDSLRPPHYGTNPIDLSR
jgi:hypothetical protein